MQDQVPIGTAVGKAGTELFSRVREIRELDGLKHQLHRDLERIQMALLKSSARSPDDLVLVPGGLERPSDPEPPSIGVVERQHHQERRWRWVRENGQGMPGNAREAIRNRLLDMSHYRQAEVEARLENLSGRLDAINSASSAILISLRQVVRPKVA